VRMTVAAANRLGLGCTVVLAGGRPSRPTGNVLLDHLLGADIVWVDDAGYYATETAIDDTCARLRADGRRPYAMPIGGASVTGAPREGLDRPARCEGLVLDPVYTGKAMAGLIAAARRGDLAGRRIVFLHTGGMPALFANAYADWIAGPRGE